MTPRYDPFLYDPFFELAKRNGGHLPSGADKWFHCVISCSITKACGEEAAENAGWYGEIGSTDPADSAGDQDANEAGRNCGGGKCKSGNEVKSCAECCEAKGYDKNGGAIAAD